MRSLPSIKHPKPGGLHIILLNIHMVVDFIDLNTILPSNYQNPGGAPLCATKYVYMQGGPHHTLRYTHGCPLKLKYTIRTI